MNFWKWPILVGPKPGPPQINFGDDITWTLLRKNDYFRGSYLHIEMDLNQKVLTLMKNLLEIITTSGMT